MKNHKNLVKSTAQIIAIFGIISLVAVGCSNGNTLKRPAPNDDPSTMNSDENEVVTSDIEDGEVAGSSSLPTKKIKVADKEVTVEVADTDASRVQGLSDRETLDEGNGMLFDFTNTENRSPGFWMKDMKISIDMIWIKDGKIIGASQNVPLPPEDDLPVYYPPSEITHVLEVPAGWYAKNNLAVGNSVQL